MAFRQLHDMAGNEVWVNTSYILWMQRSGNATTVHFAVLGGNNGRPFSQQYREIDLAPV